MTRSPALRPLLTIHLSPEMELVWIVRSSTTFCALTTHALAWAWRHAARYGGDEFVCGIGGSSLEEVERRFDAIDRLLRDDLGVGVSVGLAELAADETLDRLTARADAALLDAKKRRSIQRGK